MITKGFTADYQDVVTVGSLFSLNSINYISSYIYVYGTAGDIVYKNKYGALCYAPSAALGYHPISAIEIVSSGSVNGVTRTTGATGMSWLAADNP